MFENIYKFLSRRMSQGACIKSMLDFCSLSHRRAPRVSLQHTASTKFVNVFKLQTRGFSLVETLVAVSILSLVIAGTLTAVQKSIQSSLYSKNQIFAFYLAQEGMEFIKNIRDENALRSVAGGTNTWLTGLSAQTGDPCWFGGGGVSQKTCTIDSNVGIANGGVVACSGGFGTCPYLRQDSATGLLGYTAGWTLTNFKREIQFQSISSNEISVVISISWISGATNRSFQIRESLFNRQ